MTAEDRAFTREYSSESELSVAVSQYLAQRHDHCITRVDSGEARGKRRITAVGTPDWEGCVVGGVHVEIELKKRKGKSSPEQIARGEKVRALGGIYEVCRSVADVHATIEAATERTERMHYP